MDYHCVKFGALASAVLVLLCEQTDRQTHKVTNRITDATKRFTAATDVGVTIITDLITRKYK